MKGETGKQPEVDAATFHRLLVNYSLQQLIADSDKGALAQELSAIFCQLQYQLIDLHDDKFDKSELNVSEQAREEVMTQIFSGVSIAEKILCFNRLIDQGLRKSEIDCLLTHVVMCQNALQEEPLVDSSSSSLKSSLNA